MRKPWLDRNKSIEYCRRWLAWNPLLLDTETTGVTDADEIIEIAVVDVRGNVLVDTLVQPVTTVITPSAFAAHGLTLDDLRDAPALPAIWPEINRILDQRHVVIYNADFDERLLWQSALAHSIDSFAATWFVHDLMRVYASFQGDWNIYRGSYAWQKLHKAIEQCAIVPVAAPLHRARGDAERARLLLLHMAHSEFVADAQLHATRPKRRRVS